MDWVLLLIGLLVLMIVFPFLIAWLIRRVDAWAERAEKRTAISAGGATRF